MLSDWWSLYFSGRSCFAAVAATVAVDVVRRKKSNRRMEAIMKTFLLKVQLMEEEPIAVYTVLLKSGALFVFLS